MSEVAHFQKDRRLRGARAKVAAALAVIALAVAAFVVWDFLSRRNAALRDSQNLVREIAGNVARALDGNSLRGIRTNADAATPQFQSARAVLERARTAGGLREEDIYVVRPVRGPEEMEFVAMVPEKTFVGERCPVLPENQPALLEAWTSGAPVSTGRYSDARRDWVSGFAPVPGKNGKPVAIVEADAEVSGNYSDLLRRLSLPLALAGVAFLAGIPPGSRSARG